MKLILTELARQKIRFFVDLCPDEISGLGRVVHNEDKDLVVEDVDIFEQEVSGGHSDIDNGALAKFIHEKTQAGEDLSQWRFWWHSHAEMSSFFSPTDTDTIDRSSNMPWMASFVTNKKREDKARLDLYEPFRAYWELTVEELSEDNEELKKLCAEQIELKVRKKSYGYGGTTHLSSPTKPWISGKPSSDSHERDYDQGDHYLDPQGAAEWAANQVEQLKEDMEVIAGALRYLKEERKKAAKWERKRLNRQIQEHQAEYNQLRKSYLEVVKLSPYHTIDSETSSTLEETEDSSTETQSSLS